MKIHDFFPFVLIHILPAALGTFDHSLLPETIYFLASRKFIMRGLSIVHGKCML